MLVVCLPAFAQPDTAAVYGWKHTMTAGVNVSQISYTNWSGGGDNALSWTLVLDGKSVKDEEKTTWSTAFKFAFGQARISDKGLRKTEDRSDLESILSWKLNQYVNPYAAVTIKTQFARGYKYDSPTAGINTPVSQFFDPAYLTQSVGAGWQPIAEVKTRIGAALRETFADRFAGLYTDDPETQGEVEKSKIEGGAESVTDVEWKLAENVLFTSKLEIFAPFKKFDRWDIRTDAKLTLTVSKYIAAMVNLQVVNIEPFPRTQVKETIALGLTYNVF
jgi:hypothetical protein